MHITLSPTHSCMQQLCLWFYFKMLELQSPLELLKYRLQCYHIVSLYFLLSHFNFAFSLKVRTGTV